MKAHALVLIAVAGSFVSVGSNVVRADDKNPAPTTGQQAAMPIDLSAPLPTDPNLVTGTLPSGVRYIIRKHSTPKERAAIWMHVSTGSLNETDAQRGIAHYLEHMAFNGSANFPPGTVIKFFEDLGLTFGRHQNAFTSFDQTAYQLFLNSTDQGALKKALTFMSDVAFRLTLEPAEIEAERNIILEEKRSRLSAQQRVQETILKRIAPGSIIGERLPIGTEETIKGVQRPDFEAYWKKWYTPENVTIMVVADMDPAIVQPMIVEMFGAEAPRATVKDIDPGIKPYQKDEGVVVTDAEIRSADISFNRLSPAKPPTTTVGQMRGDLVDLIGTWAVNRRLAKKREQGQVSFLNASVDNQTLFRVASLATGNVTAEPAKWRDAFKDLATEVQRARLHGFSPQEIADARTELLAGAERQAETESSLEARALLTRYNSNINEGEPIMSAAQQLELMRKLLPTITHTEVSARFKAEFEPTNLMFTAELPEGDQAAMISESDLVKFGKEALAVQPAPEAETARIAKLIEKLPAPGKAEGTTTHAASSVTSAWLPSGVRVHHRFMDDRKDTVIVSINLAAGAINETAANRGISEVAGLAFGRPATGNLTSTQIREFMTGKKVSVSGGAGDDTMSISVSGSPADLETGMQLAHLLLSNPKIEPAAFEQWKTRTLQAIAERSQNPQGVLSEMIPDTIFPKGEVRRRPLTAEQVNAITLEAAQAYLNQVVATSAIEVSVVGDIKAEAVMPLVEQYLGSLSTRDRMSGTTLDAKRTIARPTGPIVNERTVVTKTPMAMVLDGFYGADLENVTDVRRLNMAQRILTTRMNKVIREEKNLVYSIGAQSAPATAYPGFGVFFAAAPTAKEKAADLGTTITEMYQEFAKGGPTAEEVETARKQSFNDIEQQMREPGFWTQVLGTMDYRNRKLDDVMSAKEAVGAITPEQIKETFNKYFQESARMRVTVLPE
jgi:zinc protease